MNNFFYCKNSVLFLKLWLVDTLILGQLAKGFKKNNLDLNKSSLVVDVEARASKGTMWESEFALCTLH